MNKPKAPSERVLLVDDDPVWRLLTASKLMRHGYAVTEAASGAEAIEKFAAGTDCVLLDARMPGIDGFETCQSLRKLPGGGQIPIVMLTGLDDDDSIASAYEAGATDFFVKSLQWSLLVHRVRHVLRAASEKHKGDRKSGKPTRARYSAHGVQDRGSWDVFISHAFEDKATLAKPLAEGLGARGLEVWYDDFTLTVGDSLRGSIDRGLADSRFGVVILSDAFFKKHWPRRELDGLVARESSGSKVILPVWHGLEAVHIRIHSPMLADRVAVSSSLGIDYVVNQLMKAIEPKNRS